jgi:hypothetical protein
VIAAAGQWAADYLQEAKLMLTLVSIGIKLFRADEPVNRQMLWSWRKILADCHDIYPMSSQVSKYLHHLGVGFPQSNHQA